MRRPYCLAVVLVFLSVMPGRGADPPKSDQDFSFPDAVAGTVYAEPASAYRRVHEAMRLADRANKDIVEQDFVDLVGQLDWIVENYPDQPVGWRAERKRVVLNWQADRITGKQAAQELHAIAASQGIPAEAANTATAMALVVEARTRQIEQMRQSLASLDAAKTPQFGWFAFEVIKNSTEYVHEIVPMSERVGGKPNAEELARSHEAIQFLEEVILPVMREYVANADGISDLEASQIVVAAQKAAHDTRRILARRLYPEIADRVVKDILPELIDMWELSLVLLKEHPGAAEVPADHISQIIQYREAILPRLEYLLRIRRFNLEFGPLIQSEEDLLESLDEQLLLSAVKSDGDEPDMVLPADVNSSAAVSASGRGDTEGEPDAARPARGQEEPDDYRIWLGAALGCLIAGLAGAYSVSRKRRRRREQS